MSLAIRRSILRGCFRFNHVSRCNDGLRFQSTASSPPKSQVPSRFQGNLFSHVLAGVAGGGLVVVAAYTWYHFSGIKTYVDASKNVTEQLRKTAQTFSDRARRSPNDGINYLRNVAKSYVAIIPGASSYIDDAFDKLDEVHDHHREEVDSIVIGTLQEIKTVTSEDGSLKDAKTALKVLDIVKRRMGQLGDVGKRAGGDVLGPLTDRYPEVREKIGGSYEQMRILAQSKGEDAKLMFDETSRQLKEKLSHSVDEESLEKARNLIKSKISKIRGSPNQTFEQDKESEDS